MGRNVAVLTLLTSLIAGSAFAAEVLDQQNDVGGSAVADTATPFATETGQTFTVGVAGTLSRIELQINRIFGTEGVAILTMYSTSGGVPTDGWGTVEVSAELIPPGTFAYTAFDLSTLAIPVSIGDVMAYTIKSDGGAGYGLRSTFSTSTYAGGQSIWRSTGPPPGLWNAYTPSHDNGFKTYVITAEPEGLPGDFNDDGAVDAADYVVWRKSLDDPSEDALNGNGDGMNGVDIGDYNLWSQQFGAAGGGSGGSAVPEPTTMLLLAMSVAAIFIRSQRNRS